MCGKDAETAPAHGIPSIAEDLSPVGRIVWNLLPVLLVLSVSEENHTLDLLLDLVVQLTYAPGHDRRALAVATSNHGSVGALLVSHVKELFSLIDGGLAGALGECVGGKVGRVGATNALDPDIVAVFVFEGACYGGAGAGTLEGVIN